MQIKKLTLKGYIRLLGNNIDLFAYTPESQYQLILGTNGSGKSSILAELSPLPAHKSQFSKGGYKIIEIEHGGNVYVLSSVFNHGSGKHSFKINDGDDLNPGGTAEVQKQLVLQHFDYTKDLHDVLTGQLLITRMSPADRRKWISMLSINDYSWAIGVHRKLATAARDQQGAAKHLKARLTQEHSTLNMMGPIDGLDERAHMLREELNALLTARAPNTQNLDMISASMERSKQGIETLSRDIIRAVGQIRATGLTFDTQAAMQDHAANLNTEVASGQALVNRLTSEYVELETTIHGFTTSDGITPENVAGHLMDVASQLESLGVHASVFGDIPDARAVSITSRTAVPRMMEIFAQLPDNTDRRFSRAAVDQSRERLRVRRNEADQLEREMRKVWHRIEHIRLAKGQQCPSCGHEWKDGVLKGEVETLESAHDDYTRSFAEYSTEIASVEKFLEEAERVSGLYRQFLGVTQDYPSLGALWSYINAERMHLERPGERMQVFHDWYAALEHASAVQALVERQEQLKSLQRQWEQAGGVGHLGQRMTKVMEEVETQTRRLNDLRRENASVQSYLQMVSQLQRKIEDLKSLQDQINRQFSDWTESRRSQEIDRVTHLHQSELATIQQRITEQRTLQGIVRDLEQSLESVSVSRDDLSLLADELSPIEGLIAEQLRGFIACLVGQFNAIIGSVWTKELVILPCSTAGGDLDYKFPVQTAFKPTPAADIIETSKGQEQMINIAFQLTVILYKGLKDIPLFFDEPGEGFDEQHRSNLMTFIKSLMDSGQYSQMFMVSHYASNHGMFTQAEIVALDTSNIAIAGSYNQNVVLG